MIPAYQNDLQMFPIFRMQFALLDDLCIPAIISCEKLDLRVNISGCASYGAFSRNPPFSSESRNPHIYIADIYIVGIILMSLNSLNKGPKTFQSKFGMQHR